MDSKQPCAIALAVLVVVFSMRAQVSPEINDEFPQFSPDGRSVILTSDRDGDLDVYTVLSDGTHLTLLTHSPGRDAHAHFAHSAKQIAFQSPRENGQDTNIYVMKVDGDMARQLTHLPGFAAVPVFSPDDRRIVFQWRQDSGAENEKKWRICVINADSSAFRVITSGAANDQTPNWSRDGKRLLFYSDRSGRNQIYTMKADGTDVQQLAPSQSNDSAAAWSPDNRRIAFVSDRDRNSDLYVMNSDGTSVQRLTTSPETERMAAWSPDGKRLIFSADGEGPSRIFIVDLDTKTVVPFFNRAPGN
jgi:TolB protein